MKRTDVVDPSKKTMTTERNAKIDYLKGLAIILVVWGHFVEHTQSGQFNYYSDPLHTFIFSFHMPLFAAISGYLVYKSLKKRSVGAFCVNILKSYLLPIFVWTCILELVRFLSNHFIAHKATEYSVKAFFDALFGNGFWFLWSILGCAVCVLISEKLLPEKIKWISLSIVWLLLYLLPNSERSVFLYPFYIIGYLISRNGFENKKWYKTVKMVLAACFFVLIWFYKEECYIYVTGVTPGLSSLSVPAQIAVDIYRWTIGLCGIALISTVYDVFEHLNLLNPAQKIMQDLGKYTLEIYVTQAVMINYIFVMAVNKLSFMKYLTTGILSNTFIYDFLTTPLLTAAFIAVDFLVIKLVKKSKIISTCLFGR